MDVREKLVELLTNSPQLDVLDWTTGWEEAANYLIAHGVTVQEWISVKDRLPEKFTNVLCYFPEKDYGSKAEIDYAETTDGHFSCGFKWGRPTHWLPLPQPPKGD